MTWQRLEGSAIDAQLTEATEARLADPLWLLGKQWQVGELTGDDAATPVLIEAKVAYTPITCFQGGAPNESSPILERDALDVPLETAVECEDVRHGPAAQRLSAEAGMQLFRSLEAASIKARAELRAAWPLKLSADDGLDPHGRQQLELLARRSFDAAALIAKLEAGESPNVSALEHAPGASVLNAWRKWYAELFSLPDKKAATWDAQRMEYRFRVSARLTGEPEVLLDAPEYSGGHLDWYAFDLRADLPELGAREARRERTVCVAAIPARFAGQAASRFWQVEDSEVWYGDLHVGSTDLARAAIGAYAMSFGDDWFQVPMRLPPGVLARVEQVSVRDTFGQRRQIRSCAELDGPERAWRYFELTGDASADAPKLADRKSPWLFMAPVLPAIVESRPLEEVLFLRDETANLCWGVELKIESAAGRRVDRAALARVARPEPPVPTDGAWLYRLSTTVLDHQVPLVPVRTDDGALYLQRGRLATAAQSASVTTRGALGEILESGKPLLISDAEVPTTGMRVTRSWQMARTQAGKPVVWVGRRKTAAPPRRSPALVFDEVSKPAGAADTIR
ncbi:MAG TPA: hypothetical protein VK550_00555 [Polyangiaceae bacterium]|nr:hypothetical protein [Polyangiaceae bacterium]